jgi:hypothetical protein
MTAIAGGGVISTPVVAACGWRPTSGAWSVVAARG